jgi:chitinase
VDQLSTTLTLQGAQTLTAPTSQLTVTAGEASVSVNIPFAYGANNGLAALLTESQYQALFPNGNPLFTYAGLAAAAALYPRFLNEGSAAQRAQELAAFLANAGHETTGGWPTAPGGPYAWGLYFAEEVGCTSNTPCTQYCDATDTQFPCAAGATYDGRGALQLSWNYNYGLAGAALGVDLLNHPGLVATDPTLAWSTALWFWMTAQAPKPSAHDVMAGNWSPSAADTAAGRAPGFGMTIDIINGGLECGFSPSKEAADRIGFYDALTSALGVAPGSSVDCATMQPY